MPARRQQPSAVTATDNLSTIPIMPFYKVMAALNVNKRATVVYLMMMSHRNGSTVCAAVDTAWAHVEDRHARRTVRLLEDARLITIKSRANRWHPLTTVALRFTPTWRCFFERKTTKVTPHGTSVDGIPNSLFICNFPTEKFIRVLREYGVYAARAYACELMAESDKRRSFDRLLKYIGPGWAQRRAIRTWRTALNNERVRNGRKLIAHKAECRA